LCVDVGRSAASGEVAEDSPISADDWDGDEGESGSDFGEYEAARAKEVVPPLSAGVGVGVGGAPSHHRGGRGHKKGKPDFKAQHKRASKFRGGWPSLLQA
jgi:hypothetical protein